MNLTPEERSTGKENFYEAIGSELTRRDFLQQGIAAGVVSGAGLGAMYFGYEKTIGDPLRVGVIGTGDEGSVLLGAITPSYIQVVAIADIRPYNVWRAFHGDHSQPTRAGRAPRPDDQVRLEDRRRSPQARQGLRPGLSRAAGRPERRSGGHRPAAAPARPGGHRGHEGRQARAHRKADGPQRGPVQGNGPRGQETSKSWPSATSGITAFCTTTPSTRSAAA